MKDARAKDSRGNSYVRNACRRTRRKKTPQTSSGERKRGERTRERWLSKRIDTIQSDMRSGVFVSNPCAFLRAEPTHVNILPLTAKLVHARSTRP